MISNYAIIENGKVVNVARSQSALADNWIKSDKAAIGDEYTGGEFVKIIEDPKPEKKDRIEKLLETLCAKGLLTDTDLQGIKEDKL